MTAIVTSLLAAMLAAAAADVPSPRHASDRLDPSDEVGLGEAVWRDSPDLIEARQNLTEAESARDRTRLLPNPVLGAAWTTIPIGARNPSNASFGEIPAYSATLSQLLEIGKRGPRQRAAASEARATALVLLDVYRQSFFALLESLAEQAAAVARRAKLALLISDSAESLRLQRERAAHGDVAALEVDRLEVEHLRLLSAQSEAAEAQESAVAACSRILGSDCPRFSDAEEATRFLFRSGPSPAQEYANAVGQRPDLLALRAEESRLRAELVLAGRAKIPDPTVSAGYTHDQFQIAGNQANSLNLSVSLPLPVFDRGQVDKARAKRRIDELVEARKILTDSALRALDLGHQRLTILEARARNLDERALPLSRSVVERMEVASRRGGASLIDVLLARRAFEEIELDRLDVAAAIFRARVDIRRNAGAFPRPSNAPAASSLVSGND